MKNIILISILTLMLIPGLFAQNTWKDPSELYDDYGIEYSDTDSAFYYSDYFYIVGADTIDLHIPIMRSRGMIKVWGYVTALDSMVYTTYGDTGTAVNKSNNATIYFALSPSNGTGRSKSSHFTHTFTAVDTAAATSLGEASFQIFFPEWTDLMKQPSNYYIVRMRGASGNMGKIWIMVEWINGY